MSPDPNSLLFAEHRKPYPRNLLGRFTIKLPTKTDHVGDVITERTSRSADVSRDALGGRHMEIYVRSIYTHFVKLVEQRCDRR